uniref:Uncharacterized protein n=1 Tax=Cacopsylla melanoneura TaxID=428564 RepID=A0A8D9ECH9_9HEMI
MLNNFKDVKKYIGYIMCVKIDQSPVNFAGECITIKAKTLSTALIVVVKIEYDKIFDQGAGHNELAGFIIPVIIAQNNRYFNGLGRSQKIIIGTLMSFNFYFLMPKDNEKTVAV